MKSKKAGQYFPRVRLYVGEDDDIISWLVGLPYGKKADRIKEALRLALKGGQPRPSAVGASSTVASVELDTRGLLGDIRQIVSAALAEHSLSAIPNKTSEFPTQEKQEYIGEDVMSSFDDEFGFGLGFDDDDDDDDDKDEDEFTGDFV